MIKKIIHNIQAVSPIIATLMLVLISVTAAAGFSAFVATQQEEYERTEALQQQKELESIFFQSITPVYDASDELVSITIQLVNDHGNELKILAIWLNDYQIDFEQPSLSSLDLILESFESITILITDPTTELLFYDPLIDPITSNKNIVINIRTQRQNNFEKTFHPPTSVILLDIKNEGTGDVVFLDGSLSNQQTESSYLSTWHWHIIDDQLPATENNYYGRYVRPSEDLADNNEWTITLTVIDNFGMSGASVVTYDHNG